MIYFMPLMSQWSNLTIVPMSRLMINMLMYLENVRRVTGYMKCSCTDNVMTHNGQEIQDFPRDIIKPNEQAS